MKAVAAKACGVDHTLRCQKQVARALCTPKRVLTPTVRALHIRGTLYAQQVPGNWEGESDEGSTYLQHALCIASTRKLGGRVGRGLQARRAGVGAVVAGGQHALAVAARGVAREGRVHDLHGGVAEVPARRGLRECPVRLVSTRILG